MRSVALCGIVIAAVLLMAAPAGAAVGGQNVSAQVRHRDIADAAASAAQRVVSPAVRALIEDGALTVSGSVLSWDGTPLPSTVAWGYWTEDLSGSDNALDFPYEYHNHTLGNYVDTPADGTFSFSGVTEQANGGLDAYFDDAEGRPCYLSTWNAAFSGPDPLSFTLRPGSVGITTDRVGAGWSDWTRLRVVTISTHGAAQTWSPKTGSANVMPDNLNEVDIYYWDNQGSMYRPPYAFPIASGQQYSSIGFTQSTAKRLLLTKPYWASGKPGTVVTAALQNWQGTDFARFYGQAEYPESAARKLYPVEKDIKDFNAITTAALTVPSTAVPGYAYQIHAYLSEWSMLDLTNYFQVCTLKPTKTAISRGSAIKLSGVIPTKGHWGSQAGISKSVILYKRTTSATSAPPVWDATRKGWTKVATFRANGLGKFASGFLRPTRTTWYVLRYPGDAWYNPGFTSVAKVTVR